MGALFGHAIYSLDQAGESLGRVENGRPQPGRGRWPQSKAKRIFDCGCVLLALPLLAPLGLAIAACVWITSSGPVLFFQKRVGQNGELFTLVKFRTLEPPASGMTRSFTTATSHRFIPMGAFLRRWKLDELPQMWNVLAGEMSLVGPRPKVPELTIAVLPCRPGITGAATLAFAREEALLDRVPVERVQACYQTVVLPAKLRMDAEYMEQATFLTDLRMLADTLLRRWDSGVMETLLRTEINDAETCLRLRNASGTAQAANDTPAVPGVASPAAAEMTA